MHALTLTQVENVFTSASHLKIDVLPKTSPSEEDQLSHEIRTTLHHLKWHVQYLHELNILDEFAKLKEEANSDNLSNIFTNVGIQLRLYFEPTLQHLLNNITSLLEFVTSGRYTHFLKNNPNCKISALIFETNLNSFKKNILQLKLVSQKIRRSKVVELTQSEVIQFTKSVADEIQKLFDKCNLEMSILLSTVGYEEENSAVQLSLEGITFPTKKLKILIAEDNKVNQQCLDKSLRSVLKKIAIEYDIDIVDDGDKAVDLWKEKRHHLIYMDIQMGKMDGDEATKIIRADECLESKKMREKKEEQYNLRSIIIAVTANKINEKIAKAWGINGLIQKPFNTQQIMLTLTNFMKEPPSPVSSPQQSSLSLESFRSSSVDDLKLSVLRVDSSISSDVQHSPSPSPLISSAAPSSQNASAAPKQVIDALLSWSILSSMFAPVCSRGPSHNSPELISYLSEDGLHADMDCKPIY